MTFQEERRFWGRVIQPAKQYCTPCCKCGIIQITPFSREICKFPCPIRIPTGCFPATASVTLENGKQLAMEELQVGDQVQASMFINVALLVIDLLLICLELTCGIFPKERFSQNKVKLHFFCQTKCMIIFINMITIYSYNKLNK